MGLGYDGKLFILAFDHRGSFQKKWFGLEGDPSPADIEKITDAKHLIFEGLLQPGGFYPVNLRLKLASGETRLEFETDRPGDLLTKADSRRFAFSLTEFRFE